MREESSTGVQKGGPIAVRPLTLAGRPVHRVLTERSHPLVAAVVDRLADHLPTYAALPVEALRGEISHIVEVNIAMFADVLRTGELPGPESVAALREGAARRAEEGVPLDAVVTAYHIGVRLCVQEVLRTAESGDIDTVLEVCLQLLHYLEQVTGAVAAGYFQSRQAAFGDEYTVRQSLLSALLDGTPAQEAAARAGTPLPPCYLVLSISVGAHRDERADGVNPTVAARRKLRRLRAELERHVTGTVLSMLSVDGGLALVPYDRPPGDLTRQDWNWLASVVDHMTRVSGADLTVGVAAAEPDGVGEAAALGADVREVAAVFGRGPGLYRLSDVLVEYQLTRPGPARDELATLLAPLTARPELLDTVRTFMSCAVNRRRTAALLQVHPNTVDYRIRKAAELTGLDAASPADRLRLGAALAALDASARAAR